MIEKQWGKNPEYTFSAFIEWSLWNLLFKIHWHHYDTGVGNMYSIGLGFLCFGIHLEIWRYKNEISKR